MSAVVQLSIILIHKKMQPEACRPRKRAPLSTVFFSPSTATPSLQVCCFSFSLQVKFSLQVSFVFSLSPGTLLSLQVCCFAVFLQVYKIFSPGIYTSLSRSAVFSLSPGIKGFLSRFVLFFLSPGTLLSPGLLFCRRCSRRRPAKQEKLSRGFRV